MENVFNILYVGGIYENQLHLTCGNIEIFSEKTETFEIRLIKFSADSNTGIISVACKLCNPKTEEILIGN